MGFAAPSPTFNFFHRVLRLEEKEKKGSTQHKSFGSKYTLNLVHVCKPHNQAVTSLAVDPSGKILASGVSVCRVGRGEEGEGWRKGGRGRGKGEGREGRGKGGRGMEEGREGEGEGGGEG